MNRLRVAIFLLIAFFSMKKTTAQTKYDNIGHFWFAYMADIKLNQHFSLWNDMQVLPQVYILTRHGVTYNFNEKVSLTAGYAIQFASTSFTKQLVRHEQRPWFQLFIKNPVGKGWEFQQRFRYEMRYREKLTESEVVEGSYLFYNRFRWLIGIKKTITENPEKHRKTFLYLSTEAFLVLGKNVNGNNMDQIRSNFFIGQTFQNFTIQLGYVNRFMPKSTHEYTYYHAIALWFNQKFVVKHKSN